MATIRVPFTRPYFPRAALTASNLEFWVGREAQIDRVVRGLLASTDAHYLITGYPGVGKSSFASRVISEWRRLSALQGINRVLIFNLQLAPSQSAEEIVRRLIGKVYFGSLDGQFSPDKQLAERLQLSFIQSYSKSLTETRAETVTSNKSRGATVKLPPVAAAAGDLSFSSGGSNEARRSIEVQREYNLSAVISDFEGVVHLLNRHESLKPRRLWALFRRRPAAAAPAPRILFVFDQMNELDDVQALTSLFNVPGASFLVLGGIRLKEQVASELEKGVHVLDNFQEEYLKCQWDQAERILSLLLPKEALGAKRFGEFGDYLNFFAQGLPRRIFATIDHHTRRDDDEFCLQLTPADGPRVRLGARLHRAIWKHRKRILGEYIDSVQYYSRDKALRGVYHLADRIFRVTKFTFQEANTVATQLSEAIVHNERERVLKNLLEVLVGEGLLVNSGATYSLAGEVLKWVSRIPDWLNDGFTDVQDLLEDVVEIGEETTEQTGLVRVNTHVLKPVPRERDAGREPDAADEDLSKVGPYRVLKQLGQGGMGAVYLALDEVLGRHVALKVIRPHVGGQADFYRRLLQEGRAIARLNHPNIVSIFSIEQLPNGKLVLVTEYVDGQSLTALIGRRGVLQPRAAVQIAVQIANALAHAHQMGIIHRDIKPSNIMVTDAGTAMLLDFGIAKMAGRPLSADTSSPTIPTESGIVIGTPAYMSPEQVRGQSTDQRADLYSLGVVIYEMLAGRPYLAAPTYGDLIVAILHTTPPPPSSINPSVPPELDAVVMKLLDKSRENRFASADEVVDELNEILRRGLTEGGSGG